MLNVSQTIKKCVELGAEISIVVGGGNFWRGRSNQHMDRTRADHIGMLATVMNSLALADSLEQMGVIVRVQTAIEMNKIAEPYISHRAKRHLEKGRVVIFGCGTGNPFFSTDTGAALRACEIGAEAVLMAKNIDGIYTADPRIDPKAKKLTETTYDYILSNHLGAIDLTAATLLSDNDMHLCCFGLDKSENIYKVITGDNCGTVVKN